MKNDKTRLKMSWSSNGSVIVNVPIDKVKELRKSYKGKRISEPLVNEKGDFENHLKSIDGEWLDFNHTWDGYVDDVVDLDGDDRIKKLEEEQELHLGSVDLEYYPDLKDSLYISDILGKELEDITDEEWEFWKDEFGGEYHSVVLNEELDDMVIDLVIDKVQRDFKNRFNKKKNIEKVEVN